MAVDLICPDCGGVIGGKGTDAEGRGPCTCFQGQPSDEGDRQDSSDTVSIPIPKNNHAVAPAPAAPVEVQAPKFCIFCGKNVVGHRRVKDSRGYLCYECHKKESELQKAGTTPCAECKKRMKDAGLVEYKGRRICKTCYAAHQEAEKKVIKKVATSKHDVIEKRNIMILGIIFGVLTLIVLWQTLKHLLGR